MLWGSATTLFSASKTWGGGEGVHGQEKQGRAAVTCHGACLGYTVFVLCRSLAVYFSLSYDCAFAFDLATPAAYWLSLPYLWGSFTCQFYNSLKPGYNKRAISQASLFLVLPVEDSQGPKGYLM